jgi:uncharacterized protein
VIQCNLGLHINLKVIMKFRSANSPNRSRRAKYLTPLMRAAAIGHAGCVQDLISEGADVNEKGPRNSTALMFAAGSGHTDIVKILVEKGADPLATEEGGWTALEHAIGEYPEIIAILEKATKSDEYKAY